MIATRSFLILPKKFWSQFRLVLMKREADNRKKAAAQEVASYCVDAMVYMPPIGRFRLPGVIVVTIKPLPYFILRLRSDLM
jgi:hypothetical protein